VPAAASPPCGSPHKYSPALRRVTTGFGMGPGGATALAATGTSNPPSLLPGLDLSIYIGACSCMPRAFAHTISRVTGPLAVSPSQLAVQLAFRSLLGTEPSEPVYGSEENPPLPLSTARLRSVARRPPAAS
jgi:hypothetical protein